MKTFNERKEDCRIAMESAAEEIKEIKRINGAKYISDYLIDRCLKEAYWRGAYNTLVALEKNE